MRAVSYLFVVLDLGAAMGVDCGVLSCCDEAQTYFIERDFARGHW